MSIAKFTITQTFDITEEIIAEAVKAFLNNYDYGDLMCVSTTYLGFIADQLIEDDPQRNDMWRLVLFENLKKKRKELLEAFLYELGESYMRELNRIYDKEKEREQ